jgi:hypothetical protein
MIIVNGITTSRRSGTDLLLSLAMLIGSDPVVSVEAFGQKQYTAVHPKCLSCVFDDVFIFNMRNLDKEDFESVGISHFIAYR